MKIVLCGSRSFINEMKGIADTLKNLGHKTILPPSAQDGKQACPRIEECSHKNKELFFKLKKDYMVEHFKSIENCDAVFVCNFDKNGIKNYIGGNTFVEIMYAWYLGKKIFLLNPLPDDNRIYEELIATQPIIIDGIENIKKVPFHIQLME